MNELPQQDDDALANLIGQAADQFIEQLDRGENPQIEGFIRDHPPEVAEPLRDALMQILWMRQASLSPRTQPPRMLGDFHIIREVGRGGMGRVYEAEQKSLHRRVALKMLDPLDAKGSSNRRFIIEAQAAAQLHHSNIVPVYSVGVESGIHYYAMQFIEGQTLDKVIGGLSQFAGLSTEKGRPESTRATSHINEPATSGSEADAPTAAQSSLWANSLSTQHSSRNREYYRTVAKLGIEAAEALAHAHDNGIIHRDIKPGNLMIDERGHLWVTDFGLAQYQGQSNLTRTSDFIGTPSYMSPEQAPGKRTLLDYRTDIYSLGATLYELLTLKKAFPATNLHELLRQIEREEPRKPRRWDKAIPVELETIALKAMEKNPKDRFQTAQELAEDLRRFLENRPIQAKPPSFIQRARKLRDRNKLLVNIVSLGLVIALIGSAAGIAWHNLQLAEEKQKALNALEEKKEALNQKEEALGEKQKALDENLKMTAQVAINRGAWREAIEFTGKLLESDRYHDSIPIRLDRVRALLALNGINDIARARTEIEALAARQDLGKYEGSVLLLHADLLTGRDDEKAEQLLKEALKKGLSPAEEACVRALLAETTPEAIDRLREALELNRNLPRARAALELLLILQARLDEAREELIKHETIFPEDHNAKVLRAMLLALDRDLEGANKVLQGLRASVRGVDIDILQAFVNFLYEFRNPANPFDSESGFPNLTQHLPVLASVLPHFWRNPIAINPPAAVFDQQISLKEFPVPPVLKRSLMTVWLTLPKLSEIGPNNPANEKIIDELTRAVTIHPEGSLMYLRALALLGAQRFSDAHAAAHQAATTPALLLIRRQAYCLAALTGVYNAKLNPALQHQIGSDLRQMLAAGRLSKPYKPEFTILLAWGINEFELAQRLVSEWELQEPGNPTVLYYKAAIELKTGAYGVALDIAEKYFLGKKGDEKKDDERMTSVKEAAKQKIQELAQRLKRPALEIAPTPRAK